MSFPPDLPERPTNPGAREVAGWYAAALPAGNTLSVLVAPQHDFLVCGYLACASRPFLSSSRVCVGVEVVTRDDAWCPCSWEPVWFDGTWVCRVGQTIVADVRNDGPDAAWFLFSVLGRTICPVSRRRSPGAPRSSTWRCIDAPVPYRLTEKAIAELNACANDGDDRGD